MVHSNRNQLSGGIPAAFDTNKNTHSEMEKKSNARSNWFVQSDKNANKNLRKISITFFCLSF